MRKFTPWFLLVAMIAASAPLFAASASDFYVGLLQRGIADVEAGRNVEAVTRLRLAAFGLLESVEHYELAQTHLVVALDRLNDTEATREAALRVVAAERVERKFASLGLSPAIRTAFTNAAKKVLSAAEVAVLLNAPPASSAPAQTSAKPIVNPPKRDVEPTSRPVVEKPAVTATPPSTTRRLEDPKTPPKPAPVVSKPAIDVPAKLAAGERALQSANLAEARKAYRELIDAPNLDHASAIRVAEGLYRARDFAGALAAFQRVGNLRSGEEAYRYYIAVAAYETGQFDRARRELETVLPYIELTPDVQRYRAKIEAAR